jgi:hypothetical protein
MTRGTFSTKMVLLVTGIGLSVAAFAGSQPAAAQSYSGGYPCPVGSVPYYNPYGCVDYGYYGYPYGAYGLYDGQHREFDHGYGHGMSGGFGHGGGGGHR